MTYPFNSQRGLILVDAVIEGPSGRNALLLALDTGATRTLVSQALLVAVGYDPALSPVRVQVTTASGIEFAAQISLDKITALGQTRSAFPIIAHTLPAGATIDGLLGLDFLRGQLLTIDFRNATITLA
jgi:predicted aspartyl protease